MKREEKNRHSVSKITDAALREFAAQGYSRSSINTICIEGGISKGVLYHYFKDKDELYLTCVKESLDALTAYLRERIKKVDTRGVQAYFAARIVFFQENPLYRNLFCDAIISPPPHLKEAICNIKADFDALNIEVLTELLKERRLRGGIQSEQAIDVILMFQDFVNGRYQMLSANEIDIEAHEQVSRRSLDILLYGIIEQGENGYGK